MRARALGPGDPSPSRGVTLKSRGARAARGCAHKGATPILARTPGRAPRLLKGDIGQKGHTHWGRQRRSHTPPPQRTGTPTHADKQRAPHRKTHTHPHSPHTHGGGVERPCPRASWLQRDKVTHPGALPRARCALTRARSPRALDAGRRRRLWPSTSASGRARARSGASGRASRGPQHTCAVAPHCPSPLRGGERAIPPAPALTSSRQSRVAVRLRRGGGRRLSLALG